MDEVRRMVEDMKARAVAPEVDPKAVERCPAPDAPGLDVAREIVAAYESAPAAAPNGLSNIDGQDKILPGGWVVTAADYLSAKATIVAQPWRRRASGNRRGPLPPPPTMV